MSDFNRTILVGNLTRDPEMRYTPGGQAVVNLGIAINRQWRDKQDQLQKETTYLRITVWGKQGEACANHLKKGSKVLVEGRLQSRAWETDKGEKRTSVDVVADDVRFLSGKPGTGQREGAPDDAPADDANSQDTDRF